ncbi:MAG TPA: hypothetical protein VKB76_10565, partial [Ktedonobacterales bacterium]|nr:hypothetical protein [Ktedonobacterales bacterium]
MPLAVIVTFCGIIVLAAYDNLHNGASGLSVHHEVAHELLALLEFGLTPVAGFGAASIVTGDPARELHMTLMTPYPATISLRGLALLLWSSLIAVLAAVIIRLAGYWIVVQSAPLNQLLWLAPMVGMAGLGAALALLLRNRSAAIAVLGVVWFGSFFLRPQLIQDSHFRYIYLFLTFDTVQGGLAYNAGFWLANRLILIGLGLALALVAVLLLRRNETLLGSEQ